MDAEFKIEIVLSAEELVKFGNAVAAICFFPKFVQAEAGRLADCQSAMSETARDIEFADRLATLRSEATDAFKIGDWLARKIGAAETQRIVEGKTQ